MPVTEATLATMTDVAFTYRLLPKDEWSKLTPIFASQGSSAPDPNYSVVVVAEKGDEIVGMGVLQVVPHMEPWWIKDGESPAWRKMVGMLEAELPHEARYFMCCPNHRIAAMAEHCGLRTTGEYVMTKEIK